jgi:hypothetical protein
MTSYDIALSHISQGRSYSWDLTVLLGLGIPISTPLRDKLLRGKTSSDEAAFVRAIYVRRLLSDWRPDR